MGAFFIPGVIGIDEFGVRGGKAWPHNAAFKKDALRADAGAVGADDGFFHRFEHPGHVDAVISHATQLFVEIDQGDCPARDGHGAVAQIDKRARAGAVGDRDGMPLVAFPVYGRGLPVIAFRQDAALQ